MASAISSATQASKMIHPIAAPLRPIRAALSAVAALALAACVSTSPPPAPPPPSPAPGVADAAALLPAIYRPAAWSELPGIEQDPLREAWPAIMVGCKAFAAKAAASDAVRAWQRICVAAGKVDGRDEASVRTFLGTHFSPYQVSFPDGREQGLVTGYYEPRLDGSRTRTARFNVPLYAQPDDLLVVELADLHPELKGRRVRARIEGRRVVPYWSRSEIETGLAPLGDKVLAWLADPVDAFFLQIQGSGRIELADGSVMRVGYADQNGHPYRSIARVLVDRGEMTLAGSSMQAIREWGRKNAAQLPALLDENPSYVFFREVPPAAPGSIEAAIDGPIGSFGVPVLARRTIAVDPRSIPLGTPVWLATTLPLSDRRLERLVIAQDTGGAIRGAVRADYFWGFGDEAGREAGRMRQQGRLWMLWPNDTPLPGSPR